MSTVVHYIKHWDNDTKGSISFDDNDIVISAWSARAHLIDEAIEDGVDTNVIPSDLFTITKAEVVAGVQAYAGFRSSL